MLLINSIKNSNNRRNFDQKLNNGEEKILGGLLGSATKSYLFGENMI